MAEQTFRIVVVVDPSNARAGTQSVDRELKKLNDSADLTQKLLKRAFTLIGIEEGIRAVVGLIDAYTKLQNRIRVVVQNNEILGVVTQKVFDIAERSRSSFESTAELYARTALATRDLGVSENELLGITESVNKAIILSGASAKEANNGLIQLSQGIASNRLGGDELRAVLEELPVVADVIAKQLGLTRGQLRIFSREGNISAKTVIDAFKNAREEIEQRFAKTIPTIGQALQLLRNNLVLFGGELASSAGLSSFLASAISLLARNIGLLVRLLTVFGTTLAAAKLAPFIGNALAAAQATRELAAAVAAGDAVILGSAEASRQQAAFEVELAAARVAKTEATIAAIRAEQSMAVTDASSSESAQALAVAETEAAAARLRRVQLAEAAVAAENQLLLSSTSALDVLTAANSQEATLVTIQQELIASTTALAAAQAELAAAQEAANLSAAAQAAVQTQTAAIQAALATETETLALAQGRLATAETAAAIESSTLASAFATTRSSLAALWATIAANPIGAILVGLAAVGTALFVFRNDIKLSGDGFTTLGDLTSSYFDLFKGGLQSIKDGFGSVFSAIGDAINHVFGDGTATVAGFLRGVATVVDFLLGLGQGPLLALFALITDGFGLVFRTVSHQADIFFNGLLSGLSSVGSAFSKALSGDFVGAASAAKDALSSAFTATSFDTGAIAAEFKDLGADVGASFTAGLKNTATLDFVNELLADADAKAKERIEAQQRAAGELNSRGTATPTIPPALVKITRELQDQEHLLSLINKTNGERKVESELLRIKNELVTQGAAQTSQQLSQIDQQITTLRQKAALDDADTKTISVQISRLQSLRQSVVEKTKADTADFDQILDGLRIQLLANDSLQAQVELIDNLRGQQEQQIRKTDAANSAYERGAITASEYAKSIRQIAEESRTPIEQAFHQIDLQNQLLVITRDTNAERETQVALETQIQQLAAQGEQLSPSQENKLKSLIAQNQALQRQQDLVQSVPLTQAKADELLTQKISDLDAAFVRGALSVEQYSIALEQANQATLTLVAQSERDLQQQNALLQVTAATNAQRELSVALLQAEQGLRNQGITLAPAEKKRLEALIAENQALQRQAQIITSITPVASKVQEQYLQDLNDVNNAFIRGAINGEQFAQALEDIRLKAAESGHTLEDGFTRASIKIQDSIRDMATVTEQSLTSAFNSAEGALNDFVNKGTVDVRALAQSLVADFTKIITHLLILQATEGLGLVKEKAGTGLDAGAAAINPGAEALTAGATALGPAAASLELGSTTLSTASVGLETGSGVLQTAATTLAGAIPGLEAVAAQLQAAAIAMQTAGIGSGVAGAGQQFAQSFAASGGFGFAAGGDFGPNQTILVGEQGPELLRTRVPGTIIPHSQTASAIAAAATGGGGRTTVNVPMPQVNVHVDNHIDSGEVVSSGLASRKGQSSFIATTAKSKTAMKKELA